MSVTSAELAPKVVVQEAKLGTSAVDRAAKSVRAAMTEKGADAALQIAAGKAVDPGQVSYLINENIGNERGADGKKANLTADEQTRKDKADKANKLLTDLLDKGYDNLTTQAQKDEAQKVVLDFANTVPALRNILGPLSTTDQQAFAERLLRDPQMIKLVKQGYADQMDLTKMKVNDVEKLKIDADNLQAELAPINKEYTEVDTRITAIDNLLEEYKPKKSGGASGTTYDQILAARSELLRHQLDSGPISNNLEVVKLDLQKLNNEKDKSVRGVVGARQVPEIQTDISSKELEMQNLLNLLAPHTSEMQKNQDLLQHFEAEEKALKAEKSAKETRRIELAQQKLKKEGEVKKAEAVLTKAKTDRTQYESNFVHGLESVLGNAVEKYINERISEAVSEGKAHLEKEALAAKDKRTQAISLGEVQRWFRGDRINADQVRLDYHELLTNGPDSIIRGILANQGYVAADIDKAMKDTTFVENARSKVAADVVKNYMLRGGWLNRGGKVHPDEIIKLSASPWGEKVVEQAVAGNKAVEDQIKAQYGRLPEHGKWGEFIRGMDFKKLLVLLLIIFGVAGGLGILGARGA